MKKILTVGMITMLSVSGANAGWLDSLGFGSKKEPATFQEACNKDDITKICSEVVLGSMTLTECLKSNISALSTQCATFVKKSTSDKIESAKASIFGAGDDAKSDASARAATAKEDAAAKVTAAKADADDKAAAAKASAKEASDNIKSTGADLKEAGSALKNLFGG